MVHFEQIIEALALRDDPEPLALVAEVAMLALGTGERVEARRGFELLCRLAPEDPSGWLGLVEVERAEGRVAEALDALREAGLCARLDARGRALVELTRGDLQLHQGMSDEAVESWRLAELCDPEGDLGLTARGRVAMLARTRDPR